MKLCTSIEQSQKLIELGIDINTADMYWLNRHIDLTETKYELFIVDRSNKHIDFFNSYAIAVEKREIIPAWSLSALLDLFNNKAGIAKEYGTWFAYDNGKSYCSKHFDNPIDAALEYVFKNVKTISNYQQKGSLEDVETLDKPTYDLTVDEKDVTEINIDPPSDKMF